MRDYTKNLVIIALIIFLAVSVFGPKIGNPFAGLKLPFFSQYLGNFGLSITPPSIKLEDSDTNGKVKVVTEESVIIDVVERAAPSVVTVSIKKTQIVPKISFDLDPFSDPFNFFRSQPPSGGQEKKIEQDIGSGFIISKDGLIVTNKHVVSDTEAIYKIVTSDNKEYDVSKIYRDSANDLAILKIDPPPAGGSGLKPVEMGDSSKLKVGQFVIAIGTALGEFRQTVTTGVISGLGRGISAGSPLGDFAERLDNVIQTEAAINPGNSGGPLFNSAGHVICVSTAISTEGQNIGFAIPINVIKEAIENFNKTGQFSRPFLGVRYTLIDQKTALLNEVPQGAYVQEVVVGSAAERSGIKEGDIITKIDGQKLEKDEGSLAKEISSHKVGDEVLIEVWRDGETKVLKVVLEESK